MPDTLIVGERFNRRGHRVDHDMWSRVMLDSTAYWGMMRRLPAFGQRSWAKLKLLGFSDDTASMNLLPPHELPGAWDYDDAKQAAEFVLERVDKDTLIVCCGLRVALAFGRIVDNWHHRSPLGTISEGGPPWFTRIPHPSGRNLQWNDQASILEIASRLKVNIEHLAHTQQAV